MARVYRYALLCLLPLAACEKDEGTEEPAATAELAPIDGPATVVMTVDGSTVTHVAGSGNTEIIFTEQSGGPPPDTSRAVFLSGFRTGTDTLFRVRIGALEFTGGTPTNAELLAFLAVGSRTVGTIPPDGGGLELHWRSAGGTWYGAHCGAGGSVSFSITHNASQQVGSQHYVKYRALFSGTFTACDGSGGTVAVTDGALVLRVNDGS
jgi:hypothetical protein